MINFHIITIFPEIFSPYLNASILKRGQKKGALKIFLYNPRDFAEDKHRAVDSRPYGGGPGMVMKAEPILKAAEFLKRKMSAKGGKNQPRRPTWSGLRPQASEKSKFIIFSPRGKQFTQKMAANWAKKYKNLLLISGHYEGVDERVKRILKVEEISIGPYILTGGELPAMIVVDAVSRHIPGVLGKKESLEEAREEAGAPLYTRPEVLTWKNKKYKVPKVLLSGHHQKIKNFRRSGILRER